MEIKRIWDRPSSPDAAIDGSDPDARTSRMVWLARSRPFSAAFLATAALTAQVMLASLASADTVLLKNGTVLRGTVDRDKPLIFVNDNLKRVIFYDSKVAKIDSDTGFSKLERFALVQPLEVHVGIQPPAAVSIQTTPWDAKGRRMFRYVNNHQRPVEMQQAINELGPFVTRFRGIDGFWQGQVSTSQVPRSVILGLLGKVEQTNQDERLKVTRWLIQAEWYPEATSALDGLLKDFPNDKSMIERVADTRRLVLELEARQALEEVAFRRKALQPTEVLGRLRSIPTRDLPKEVLDEVRDQIRKDEDQAVTDRQLGDTLRDLNEKLSEADRKAWKGRLAEVLEVLNRAPDAARPRLAALAKADPAGSPESRFALALSGWVVGTDPAVDSLETAGKLWQARTIVRDYLASRSDVARASLLADLQKVEGVSLDTIAQLVVRMDPPLRDPDPSKETPGQVTLHRVLDDDNPVPSEYALLLPPEYHPSRIYPAVIALHDGRGPKAATDWLAAEAARRGYIVIAPEYTIPGMSKEYRYTTGEQAAAVLSLRDARKRYSIDSDRVYVAGQLEGGNMAWDLGLAHADHFAGVVAISGLPGKYVYKYKKQVDDVPLYIALGEMAPAAREFVFDTFVKPMILKVQDVTYVDYLKRGLEELPEEVPSFFDWMDRHKRDPIPKGFDADTARDGDDRFFGVIVRDIAQGRVIAPEAVDPLGKNINAATIKVRSSAQANSITITTSGINRLDYWVSPRLVDFKKKLDVTWNGRPLFRGTAKLEPDSMLEDLRIRGDRQQIYYFKIVMGMGANPRTKGR
jgi:dienelactone hydrolase